MTNTRPVPNLNAPIGNAQDSKGNIIAKVYLIAPWMQFWQQFVQKAPAVVDVTSSGSPYTANQNGTVIINGTGIFLTRGQVSINLGAGQKIIPIAIGDTVSWATASVVQFLGD